MSADKGYWVLPLGGYPDTRSDYAHWDNREGVPADCFVYDGSRKPWKELDPYPDFVTSRTETVVRWDAA